MAQHEDQIALPTSKTSALTQVKGIDMKTVNSFWLFVAVLGPVYGAGIYPVITLIT